MNAKDVFKNNLEMSHWIARAYLEDMADEQLFVRAVEGSNHMAWALGHLIASDRDMLATLGHAGADLPAGFAEAYTKETSTSDDASKFHTKADYLALMDKCKAACIAAIDATPDADLDQPAPEAMREYAPTIGAALGILGSHWLMHAGQWVPIRRKLGKAAIF